jgi:hypothetical protein
LHLVHQEDPKTKEQKERQDVGEQAEQAGAALAVDGGVDVVAGEPVEQGLLEVVGVAGRVLLAVGLLDLERVVLGIDRDLLERLRVAIGFSVPWPGLISRWAKNASRTTIRIGKAALLKKRLNSVSAYQGRIAAHAYMTCVASVVAPGVRQPSCSSNAAT